MLPLDLRHLEQAVGPLVPTVALGESGGGLVLAHVAALNFSRPEHRREPTGDVAKDTERATNAVRTDLEEPTWSCSEFAEYLADELAMVPLLPLDRADPVAIDCRVQRVPVPTVSISSRALTRVGGLQQCYQLLANVVHNRVVVTRSRVTRKTSSGQHP